MTIKSVRPPLGGWLEKKLSRQEMVFLWDIIGESEQDMNEFLACTIQLKISGMNITF